MKRYIRPICMVFALILVIVFQSSEQDCSRTTTSTVQAVTNALSKNGPPDSETSHCLVYGKYCLGSVIHSPITDR